MNEIKNNRIIESEVKMNIEIRRPNGDIELSPSKFFSISDSLLNKMRVATKEAGRGEVLRAVEIITETTRLVRRSDLTENLAEAIGDLYDAQTNGIESGIYEDYSELEKIVNECKKMLTDFDIKNPNVIAKINSDKAAEADRLIASGF